MMGFQPGGLAVSDGEGLERDSGNMYWPLVLANVFPAISRETWFLLAPFRSSRQRLASGRGKAMNGATTTTRPRPRSLPSTTTKLQTEFGNLYVTVSTDEEGEPFEVFGWLGKGGSFQHGVTELACRLISLHLRRGTPVEEIIDQCQGIAEMKPFFGGIQQNAMVVGMSRSVPRVTILTRGGD